MREPQVKRRRVAGYLRRKGLHAVLLSNQDNFAWFTGGADSHVVTAADRGIATLVVTARKAWCVTTNIEQPRLRDEEIGDSIEIVALPWHDDAALAAAARRLAGKGDVASDDGSFGTPRLDADWSELRYSLTPEEVDRYRALGADCSEILETLGRSVRPGDTEATLAARLHALACRRMITTFVCLIAADERILKYRHPTYTPRPVRRCAMIVLCGRRHGLIASLTRLVHLGRLPADLRRRHEACCAVDAAFILATRVGRPVGEIFDEAVRVYADRGFPEEWRLHHQGGPTGYAGRDYFGRRGETRTVQPEQAFAWNPSITGTKSEDTILVAPGGIEVLTPARDWPVINAEYCGDTMARPAILEL